MRTKIILGFIALFIVFKVNAQETSATIKIKTSATCDMCKETIEKFVAFVLQCKLMKIVNACWVICSKTVFLNREGIIVDLCIKFLYVYLHICVEVSV